MSAGSEHDDHHRESKKMQAQFFDWRTEDEFEIARPFTGPRLYQWMIAEKMRRGLSSVGPVTGLTALVVCGGSGMEAEYLARRGARVVTSDISMGATRRAMIRAARRSLGLAAIAADVESLPFRDGAFDLVLVHDGLHHLENPRVGLREMARVTRRFIVVSEPARAAVTNVAIRLGLALSHEDAGNRIARLDAKDVCAQLRESGVEPLHIQRYCLYYRHTPGLLMRLLSAPVLLQIAVFAWRSLNAVAGRLGNKLVVAGERTRGN